MIKRVLLASYYFPPQSHPGIQRPLKFAKYLPLFGYQPIVFTCANVPWHDFDYETYETEVKGRMIVRSVSAPNFKALGRPISMRTLPAKAILKLQTILFEDRMEWALGGRAEFVARARDDDIDLVYTTGPPHSVHFIGSYLKARLDVPWVADFRDPMAKHAPVAGQSLSAGIVNAVKMKTLISLYESIIVRKCDALVNVSGPITDDFKLQYPRHASKMVTITNGFDEIDFAGVKPRTVCPGRFNLVYTGRFWHHQSPDVFLSGLELALAQVPALKKDLAVTFIGPHDPRLQERMTSGTLSDVISTRGPVSHREAIAYQLGSDANLLILSHPGKKGRSPIYSGKIFEYLRAGRPILAVVPKGPARRLIEENNLGYLADPAKPDEVARTVVRLYNDWEAGTLSGSIPPRRVVERFSRENLTQTLANIFDRCL